jgi:hypothetical protein
MRRIRFPFFTITLFGIAIGIANAHEGRLDGNGCHYDRSNGSVYHCHKEVAPNPDRRAPVKKSRENICHDQSSPNYQMLRYFFAYRNKSECLRSGGRETYQGH